MLWTIGVYVCVYIYIYILCAIYFFFIIIIIIRKMLELLWKLATNPKHGNWKLVLTSDDNLSYIFGLVLRKWNKNIWILWNFPPSSMRSRSSFLNIIFDHLQKELCLFDFRLTMYNFLKTYFFQVTNMHLHYSPLKKNKLVNHKK